MSTFFLMYVLSRREKRGLGHKVYGYEMAVVQAFTAASNNFVSSWLNTESTLYYVLNATQELAIAIAIAVYGVNSEQALAATIGPLTEVPVLLGLTWVALYLKHKLNWGRKVVDSP
jgi:ACR3 family arsenite transporter